MKELKLAVGYVRCSTDMQQDSPDQQKKEILTFAEKHGYHIQEWFEDHGQSGTSFNQRPAFQRLWKRVENNPDFLFVIAYDESRWGRPLEPEENAYWRFSFRLHGVDVILVRTSIDPGNEFAPMMAAFEGVQAFAYSKKLSEVTLRGSMNNGKYSNGGTAPYGYRRMAINLKTGEHRLLHDGEWCIPSQEKVIWVPGEEGEIQTVHLIFQQRSIGIGYISIVALLNQRDIPCPGRGRWRNKDRKWSTVTIKTLIENPAYYGARAYNRNSMSKIQAKTNRRVDKRGVKYPHWKNPESEWVVEENAHDAIISKDIWLKANSFKKTTLRKPNQYATRGDFLLTGKIRCLKCGFAFQGNSTKSKGKIYRRYIDGGWNAKRVCQFLSIKKERIEQFALAAVREILEDEVLMRYLESAVRTQLKNAGSQAEAKVQNYQAKLGDLMGRKSNLLSAVSRTSSSTVVESLLSELEDIERQIGGITESIQTNKTGNTSDSLLLDALVELEKFRKDAIGELEKAEPSEKKLILQRCIQEIAIDREQGQAICWVRELPALEPELAELMENKKAHTTEESCTRRSSGGRT